MITRWYEVTLSQHCQNYACMHVAGAVPALLDILRQQNSAANKELIIGCLRNISCNKAHKPIINSLGALPLLVHFLGGCNGFCNQCCQEDNAVYLAIGGECSLCRLCVSAEGYSCYHKNMKQYHGQHWFNCTCTTIAPHRMVTQRSDFCQQGLCHFCVRRVNGLASEFDTKIRISCEYFNCLWCFFHIKIRPLSTARSCRPLNSISYLNVSRKNISVIDEVRAHANR